MNTTRELDTSAVALSTAELEEVQGGLPGFGSLMALIAITCATVPDACTKNEDTTP